MTEKLITIDGSQGEGGGQILRTSLGLSLVTGRPFRIERIRAGRDKPGLLRQHLTAVNAATQVGLAQVDGANLGSQALTFRPGQVSGGDYSFQVGTAGSTTLVLQTILPALVTAPSPSTIAIEGGTHNPFAPPFDFMERAFLPLVSRMGPVVKAELERPGFYPAGGGRFRVAITPNKRLERLDLLERGEVRGRKARAVVASLDHKIAERELRVIARRLSWPAECLESVEVKDSAGPGNIVTIEIASEHVTEVFTGFGERHVAAEAVAARAADEACAYLASGVPVGAHLADQLLLLLALAGQGSFRTVALTPHSRTNIAVIREFLDVSIGVRQVDGKAWEVEASHPSKLSIALPGRTN